MNDKKYFTFKKEFNLPVVIQVESSELITRLSNIFSDLSLDELNDTEVEGLKVTKESVILRVTEATSNIEKKIYRPHAYEKESLFRKEAGTIYMNNNNSLLLFNERGVYWQMAISSRSVDKDLKVAFNRFFALALKKLGILGFWGLIIKEKLLVTTKEVSSEDCFFVDFKNKKIFDARQRVDLDHEITFGKLDLSLKVEKRLMSKEEFYSFLINNTSYFGMGSFPKDLQDIVLNIVKFTDGFVYPENNFERAPKEFSEVA